MQLPSVVSLICVDTKMNDFWAGDSTELRSCALKAIFFTFRFTAHSLSHANKSDKKEYAKVCGKDN